MRKNQLFAKGLCQHGEILLAWTEAAYAVASSVDSVFDAVHADLGDELLRAVLGEKFTVLNLTDGLDMSALGQTSGVLSCTAKRDAFVPSSLCLSCSRLTVLPSTLGREGEDRQGRVVAGGSGIRRPRRGSQSVSRC
jgi:hypothetical protein